MLCGSCKEYSLQWSFIRCLSQKNTVYYFHMKQNLNTGQPLVDGFKFQIYLTIFDLYVQ
jgi:hypothetical protein